MPRRRKSRSANLAFEFTGDEAAEARASLQQSAARRRKRKRSVLGLSTLLASAPTNEPPLQAAVIEPSRKKRRTLPASLLAAERPVARAPRRRKHPVLAPDAARGNVAQDAAASGRAALEYVPPSPVPAPRGAPDAPFSPLRRSPRTPRPSAKVRSLRLWRREKDAAGDAAQRRKRPRVVARETAREGGEHSGRGMRGDDAKPRRGDAAHTGAAREEGSASRHPHSNETAVNHEMRQESPGDDFFASPVMKPKKAVDEVEPRTPEATAKSPQVSPVRTPVKVRLRERQPAKAEDRESATADVVRTSEAAKQATPSDVQVLTPVRLRLRERVPSPAFEREEEEEIGGLLSPVEDRVAVHVWDPQADPVNAEDESEAPRAGGSGKSERKVETELPGAEIEEAVRLDIEKDNVKPEQAEGGSKGRVTAADDTVQVRQKEVPKSGTKEEGVPLSASRIERAPSQLDSPTNSRTRERGSVLPASQRRFAPAKEEASRPARPEIAEENAAAPMPPTFSKRVRFSEPQKSYRPVKVGVLGFMKLKRRRSGIHRARDVAVVTSGPAGQDEKGRQVLLDQLQYVLDGVFKSVEKRNRTPMTTKLLTSSLEALVKLLLRKGKKPTSVPEAEAEEECGEVLQILATQPQMLKKILTGLFGVLGISRLVDVLLSLVFVIIFRSTSRTVPLEESFLDSLIQGFLRNSGSSLTDEQANQRKRGEAQNNPKAQMGPRRRGKLGRLSEANEENAFITTVNGLVKEAGIKDEAFKGFRNESDGSAFLMGESLSLLLEGQERASLWMRENRRLDMVVAVLYSCEKVLRSKSKPTESPGTGSKLEAKDIEEHSTLSVVTGAAMRILEVAMIDQTCQLRVATESNVCRVILDIVRLVTELDRGIVSADSMIGHALRLAINLVHDCKHGAQQFVKLGGPQVIVDCLVRECLDAGLIESPNDEGPREEAFDVRVLCLALLASVVDEEDELREGFRRLRPRYIPDKEGGAITLVLELLENAGKKREGKTEADKADHGMTEDGTDERRESRDRSSVQDDQNQSASMEQRVTVGYLCLLAGVLAYKCEANLGFMRAAMPDRGLLAVATVLGDFLEFQHEVGLRSVAMDRMYKEIIESLVAGAELPLPAGKDGEASDKDGKESKDKGKDMDVGNNDGEGEDMDVDRGDGGERMDVSGEDEGERMDVSREDEDERMDVEYNAVEAEDREMT